jgi:hypothetical protein
MSTVITPGELASALNAAPDMTVTTTPTALPSLAAASKEGILVTYDGDNDPASRCRVASNATASVGVRLAPGQSWTFRVANAADLLACIEAAVTGGTRLVAEQA